MIDFPDSPTVGQVFSAGQISWQWDGEKWVAAAEGSGTGGGGPGVGLPPSDGNTYAIQNQMWVPIFDSGTW